MVQERLQQGQNVPGAVGTLMTNMAVEVALQQQGVDFIRAKVGDRYVLEALHEKGWQIGGEGSGHLLALDKHSTGDGLVSALQVLQSCVRSQCTLAQQLSSCPSSPKPSSMCVWHPGQDWKRNTLLAQTQAKVEAALGKRAAC